MDIEARKLGLIQEVIKLKSEEMISTLEKFFKSKDESILKPFSVEQLEERISKSENDFENGRVTTSEQLLSEIKGWS